MSFPEQSRDARAGAARELELRELESRVAQEEVHRRRTETRALQQVEDDEARSEVERRIKEMRDELAEAGAASQSSRWRVNCARSPSRATARGDRASSSNAGARA